MSWITENESLFQDKYTKFERYLVYKRFFKYVTVGKPNECWEWKGGTDEDGYGIFNWHEKKIKNAHVAAYELFTGKRHGLCVCHKCDNPPCCNPNHLWLGTRRQNNQDMMDKGRHKRTNAKLTPDDAKAIRKLYAEGKLTQIDIGKKYKVHNALVSRIISNKAWRKK
jgi:hypothetical protein